jgi:hypothetical protein
VQENQTVGLGSYKDTKFRNTTSLPTENSFLPLSLPFAWLLVSAEPIKRPF